MDIRRISKKDAIGQTRQKMIVNLDQDSSSKKASVLEIQIRIKMNKTR